MIGGDHYVFVRYIEIFRDEMETYCISFLPLALTFMIQDDTYKVSNIRCVSAWTLHVDMLLGLVVSGLRVRYIQAMSNAQSVLQDVDWRTQNGAIF